MKRRYRTIDLDPGLSRRDLLKTAGAGTVVAGGIVLGVPGLSDEPAKAAEPETNIADFLKTPRGPHALPGPFPGRVVKVSSPRCLVDDKVDGKVVGEMFETGLRSLTGKKPMDAFRLFFTKDDVVGLKVNPVGPPLISTRHELVDAVIRWLEAGGLPRKNVVLWDRFEGMLRDAGFTADRFPGVRIEGLQTMDEEGASWKDSAGRHVSEARFDQETFYLAKGIVGKGVKGYTDDESYRNQHVFTGEKSFFGKLVSQRLTKIVNLAAYKNTGNGISMATKNLGYGSICNTGRLHAPLFFKVCTEVLAAPSIREKLVLNVTDGIRGQYDGGPDKAEKFVYPNRALYFATDPFALDLVCHRELVARRKAEKVAVNEHPRFTDYLFYAEKLGLGAVSEGKLNLVEAAV